MEKLEEYLKTARTILTKISLDLYKDEDVVTDVATELMLADDKWDGRGSLFGYRKQRVKWYLSNLYSNRAKFKHEKLSEYEYADRNLSNVEKRDYVENLLKVSKLTQHQQDIIRLRFWQDMTFDEIGNKLGISRQAAHECFSSSLKKIKLCVK